ncbi:MAG: helix-turn-helix transcriptional regulator, partial [Pseudomonadota bacterium]
FTQTVLAKEAGIGVATLRRIEGGQDGQLESWLKLLKALNMASAIDALLPENFTSPMAEVRSASRRKRSQPAAAGIVWGDETS